MKEELKAADAAMFDVRSLTFDGMAKKGEGEIGNEQPAFATPGP
jgi:hypothetical protein